jgi:hypothetical protein
MYFFVMPYLRENEEEEKKEMQFVKAEGFHVYRLNLVRGYFFEIFIKISFI